jgi:sugar phosphate isomerase/epimerase
MNSRRKFLVNSSALLLGTIALPRNAAAFFSGVKNHTVGLQLFTLFNIMDDDVKGNLQKVADIGFKDIESAFSKKGGYYGMSVKEFKSMLNGLGMNWRSHHVLGAPFKMPPGAKMPNGPDGKPLVIPPMRNLRDNTQELVDEAAAGGVKFLVCANTPINTADDIKASTDVLNKAGELCKKTGIGFAYHNHDAEFNTIEGIVPYEYFLKQTSADTVKMELDLAWAIKGGKDPVELFKQNPGRFPLWHVKDLDASRNEILPVGSGTINFKPIFDAAATAGMQHFYVEHDMPKDAFASMKSSMDFIKKNLIA